MERFYVDGQRVTSAHYKVPAGDEGLLLGLTAFETIRTYRGCLFRVEAHVQRLLHSVEMLGLPGPPESTLLAEIHEAIQGFAGDARLRYTLTMGGHRLIHAEPLSQEVVGAPLRVVTKRWEPPPWLSGRVKHGSRAFGEVARRAADADEVLWVGSDGCLTEGARSSVFAVIEGTMLTPPDDGRILPGITRQALLDAGREAGLPIREEPIPAGASFHELYCSSTLRELAPIVKLDGRPAPGEGALGRALLSSFHELVARECQPGRSV